MSLHNHLGFLDGTRANGNLKFSLKRLQKPVFHFIKALILVSLFSTEIHLHAQTTKTVGGTGGADYSTLKAAFDAINAGSVTGSLVLNVISSTTESATATLNASGSGSASYSDITIMPVAGSKLTISGNLAGGLVDLNGAANVTIDGQNTTDSLVLENTNTSGYTLRFNNSASNNTVTRVSILGGNSSSSSGVVVFANASGSLSSGNNGNTISYCEITKTSGGNKPVNGIYSSGTAGKPNQANVIDHCAIYDFMSASTTHAGIFLASNNTAWNIYFTSLYRVSALTITGPSVVTYGIYIFDGGGYDISNNAVGYADASLTGTFNYDVNNTGHKFCGIYMRSTSTAASTIGANYVSNIEVRAGANDFAFWGIALDGNTGSTTSVIDLTINNNNIGSISDADAIVLKTTGRLDLYGFWFEGFSTTFNFQATLTNNNIGSINSGTTDLGSCYASMMYLSGNTSSSFNVSGNIIGETGNGIISPGTTSATGEYQIYGAYLATAGSIDFNSNAISNLYENSAGTSNPWVYGIYQSFSGGTASTAKVIRSNDIHDIVSYSGYTSRVASGIYLETGNNTYTLEIYDNLIHNIMYAGGVSTKNHVSGIAVPSTSQKIDIYRNTIYDIENNSTYTWSSLTFNREGISGIEMNNATNTTNLVRIFNNRIYLSAYNGGNSLCVPIKGIEVYSLSAVYFNTVVISGAASGSGAANVPTACITGGQYLEIPVYNNILYNNRTGNGRHYAIANDGYSGYTTTDYTFFTDNNLYYTSNSAMVGRYGVSDLNFAQWQSTIYNGGSGPQVDVNSINNDPDVVDISDVNLWYAASGTSPIRNAGVPISGINADYGLSKRNPVQPYIGAYETRHVWVGFVDNDWANGSNWSSGFAPNANDNMEFDFFPTNDCVLDGDKAIADIVNMQSTYKMVLNGHELQISGNIDLSNGAIIDGTASGSTLHIAGTDLQMFPAGSIQDNELYNLTINNDSSVVFNDSIIVDNVLTMAKGILNMRTRKITIGTSASNPGTISYTAGSVTGTMRRWYAASTNSGASTALFPMNINGHDRFAQIEYGSAPSSGGTLTVFFNPSAMGSSGLPINAILATGFCSIFDVQNTADEGYWDISPGNGLTGGSYDITLTGEGINIDNLCEITAIKRVSMGSWFESGTHQEATGTLARPVIKRTGASGWSNWGFGIGPFSSLPVTVTSIKAVCDHHNTVVRWQTASEINNKFFIVQRSDDGNNWTDIGQVDGHGNSQQMLSYSFVDANTLGHTYYYRLAQVDMNERVAYTQLCFSNCAVSSNPDKLTTYPNPVGMDLSVSNHGSSIGDIKIYNSVGSLVYESHCDESNLHIDTRDLEPGVYLVVTDGGASRFVKQ